MKSTDLFLVSVTILLTIRGSASQLVFKDSPASATVLVNFPTTLRCSAYEPTPPANILWLRNGVISDSDPRGRYSVSYDPATGISMYAINTVSYLDVGNYQCFAVNSTDGILASSTIGTLTVQGHPGFARPLPSVIVPLGGTAVFDCAVLSNPLASVNWTYEFGSTTFPVSSGSRITISPPTTLTITDVQMSDEGFYVCQATNTYGRNSTSGRLTIGTPPPQLNLMVTPSFPNPLILNQGDSLSLSCSVTAGSLFSSLQWTRGSTLVTGVSQTANTLLLSIPSVQFEDGGVYTCTVVDGSGNSEAVSISVEVDVPPQFTTTPEDILAIENVPVSSKSTCTAVGEPDPTITWLTADGTALPVENDEPQFGTLTRGDAGVFTCVASNSAGELRQEFTVTVEGPPVFTVTPANTEASYGQDVIYQCIALGPPVPKYSWERVGNAELPGGSIISSDSTTLHLFSVSMEDEGAYQCSANNVHGSITAQGTLSVLTRPQILNVTSGPLYLEIGTSFSLGCVYTGPLSLVLVWYLNGRPLSPSQDPNLNLASDGTLTVTSPQEQYSGEYVCNVTTSFAFDIARVTVIIGSPPQLTLPPSNVDLPPGSTTTLSCESSGLPLPWSTWFKTNNIGEKNELPTIGATFTKLTTGLELHDVVREDSGVYECMVQNGIGTAQQTATVRVEGIPLATGISPEQLTAGETAASLECNIDFNYPLGSVTWSRSDGVELSPETFTMGSKGELLVSVVAVEDQAEYVCTVANSYGESSISAFVVVLVTPSINLTSTQVTALVKTTVTITCPASGQPIPSIQWLLSDGRDASTVSDFSVDSNTGELTLSSPDVVHEGTLTCVASNVVGSASAQIELLVRGPAVGSVSVQIRSTSLASVTWSAPPPDATLLMYELDVGRPGGLGDRITMQFTQFRSQTFVTGLLPGTEYEFIVRGLFTGGLRGLDTIVLDTTDETAPTGPPQNITVYPLEEAFGVNWTLPLESERNGVIISYTIFYRRTPLNATLDPPFTNITYPRNNLGEVEHSLFVENLEEEVSYDLKILASTAVGDGPESTLTSVTTLKLRTFDPVDFPLVLNIVIGVGAGVLGSLLLVAIVMALCLVSILCWRRCTKVGKHKPLIEEQAFDRQKSKTATGKISISGPIPGITPKFDNSVDGKFTVQGENGRVLNLKPKIIREEDVATPPRDGQSVKVVPRDEILGSQENDDVYNVPADAIDGVEHSLSHPQSGKARNGRVVRPESGIYSEVQDARNGKDQSNSYQPQDWGREAAEESETNLVEPEVVVIQPPSPERRGPEGEDTGRDNAQLIYATVSEEHKQKKRDTRSKEQDKQDAKLAKEQKKMQEKMEREQKKQEAKRLKQEEKERKARAKDQKLRSSMGLDNVVHLHELDHSKGGSHAQAQFIDAATAALF